MGFGMSSFSQFFVVLVNSYITNIDRYTIEFPRLTELLTGCITEGQK